MRYIKQLVIFLSAWFACSPAWGQSQTEESMQILLKKTDADTSKIRIMCDFSWNMRSRVPEKAFEYAQKAHKLARDIRDSKAAMKALSFMGVAMRNLGNYGIAGNYFEEGLLLAQKHKNQQEEGFGYINLGNILYLEGKYQEALIYVNRAVPIAQHLKHLQMKAYIWINLGRIYQKLHRKKETLEAFEQCLTLRRVLKDSTGMLAVQYEMAEVYAEEKHYTQALILLANIEASSKKHGDIATLASCDNVLAKIAAAQGNMQQARSTAEKGLQSSLDMKDKTRIAVLYLTLANVETASKNYQKAFEYLSKHNVYQDSLHKEALSTHADQWEFSYEIQRKEAEIQRDLIEIQRRGFWMLILIAALIFTLVVGGLVFLRYRQNQKTNKEIIAINLDLKESRNEGENYNQELTQLNDVLHNSVEALRLSEDQQKRLNQILTDKNNTLQEMSHEKDSLMGIVAHDLKAPLNRIRGILELLNLSGELNEDQKQLLEMGHGIINSGSNLIRDLLDITYYEQNTTKLHWEKLNWHAFLSEHIATFSQEAQQKNITLHYSPPNNVIESISDEDYLSRIISNLLSNAIKFSPKGKAIYVDLQEKEGEINIHIKDEGPGFSEEDKQKLFHKFEKLSAKPTGGEASSGLGLSIIKVLTEKLEGEVSLISEINEGATFTLVFPKKNGSV